MKVLSVLAVLFLSPSAFSLTINITLDLQEEIRFSKESSTVFREHSSIERGHLGFSISEGGEEVNMNQVLPAEMSEDSMVLIKVKSKDKIVFSDEAMGITKEIDAKVKRSLTRKVTSIKIPESSFQEIYGEALEEAGLTILEELSEEAEDIRIETNLEFSEIKCEPNDFYDLVCVQTAKIHILATDEVEPTNGQANYTGPQWSL